MVIRTISGIVGLPILAAFVIIGGIPLKIGILFLSLMGMYELFKAVSKEIKPIYAVSLIAAAVYILFLELDNLEYLRMGIMLLTVVSMMFLVFSYGKISIFEAAVSVLAFLYIPFMLSDIYLLRNMDDGNFLVWFVFICAWCSDTGAYFVGCAFGKHKLTPVLSPKKTIEGALGGIIFTALMSAFYGYCMFEIWDIGEKNMSHFFAVVGVVGSVVAQLGDLAASAVKRQFDIKDYGKIMPGHGGVLDRFDSVLFTAPLIYIFINIGKEVFF